MSGWVEGGQEGPPTSFSPGTSTNVGTSSQNILTFSFSPFGTLMLYFKFLPSASLKLLNFNQDHLSNPYKIEVDIASLTEMLQLPNFGHIIKSRI